jgi:hypothetical protein
MYSEMSRSSSTFLGDRSFGGNDEREMPCARGVSTMLCVIDDVGRGNLAISKLLSLKKIMIVRYLFCDLLLDECRPTFLGGGGKATTSPAHHAHQVREQIRKGKGPRLPPGPAVDMRHIAQRRHSTVSNFVRTCLVPRVSRRRGGGGVVRLLAMSNDQIIVAMS